MLNFEREISDNISNYGAEGILVEKVTLGSWEDLAQGNGRVGYTVRTIDKLLHSSSNFTTRAVASFEIADLEHSMSLVAEVAKLAGLEVVDKTQENSNCSQSHCRPETSHLNPRGKF